MDGSELDNDTELVIKFQKMEAQDVDCMVFTKAYFSKQNLMKKDGKSVEVGGITVEQQFVGWIQKFGEVAKTDVIITKSGDLAATKPEL